MTDSQTRRVDTLLAVQEGPQVNRVQGGCEAWAPAPRARFRRSAADPDILALVIAAEDGTVLLRHEPALRLTGHGVGLPCWSVVGGLENAEGLPCADGCVRELLAGGFGQSRETRFSLEGQHVHLSCVSLGEVAVSLLSSPAGLPPRRGETLSPREQEVLRLLADGGTTASIARRLKLGNSTVRTHVEHMREKLRTPTRGGLVALGFRLGYLN